MKKPNLIMGDLKSLIAVILTAKSSLESYLSANVQMESSNPLQMELTLLRDACARFDLVSSVFTLFADPPFQQDANPRQNDHEIMVIDKALRESEDRIEQKIEQAIRRFVAMSNDQTDLKLKLAEMEVYKRGLEIVKLKGEIERNKDNIIPPSDGYDDCGDDSYGDNDYGDDDYGDDHDYGDDDYGDDDYGDDDYCDDDYGDDESRSSVPNLIVPLFSW